MSKKQDRIDKDDVFDISFDDALTVIANTPKENIDKSAHKDDTEDQDDKK